MLLSGAAAKGNTILCLLLFPSFIAAKIFMYFVELNYFEFI